jgi:hypothetical protein
MHALASLLAEHISSGLSRSTIRTCSRWAEKYRMMGQPFPGPWSFTYHPWLREMHDCNADMIVGQKAAQLGYTECALNKVFYAIDIKGTSVLYILPATTPDASDFSTSRFDPALEMSPHLTHLFSDVKNIGHKRAGSANLFVRGSRSRSQLKSVPVGLVILDEEDEMVQENVPLVFERMSGQIEKQCFRISTPTIDDFGINKIFKISTQNHFFFPCPHCGKLIDLQFPRNIVITAKDKTDSNIYKSYIKCHLCEHELDHKAKPEFLGRGKWVPAFSDRLVVGYYVNQLYSSAVKPWELASLYLSSLTNPFDEQEFFNSKLGLPHIVEGAKITDSDIAACTHEYHMVEERPRDSVITIGIDVGKWLHYEVDQWFFNTGLRSNDMHIVAQPKVLKVGKVLDFEELDNIVHQYRPNGIVIDANPERRKAFEFCQRFYGIAKMCFYGNNLQRSKQINVHPEEEQTITVDRTSWLDLSLSRIKGKRIKLPGNLPEEYKINLKSLARIYDKDANGNPVGRYIKGNEDDHFAHARNYAEIALSLAAGALGNTDISGVY